MAVTSVYYISQTAIIKKSILNLKMNLKQKVADFYTIRASNTFCILFPKLNQSDTMVNLWKNCAKYDKKIQ